jgi:hypothetical protein
VVLEAEPGATVHIGLRAPMEEAALGALVRDQDSAALVGALVPVSVRSGDTVLVPAGVRRGCTVLVSHASGPVRLAGDGGPLEVLRCRPPAPAGGQGERGPG